MENTKNIFQRLVEVQKKVQTVFKNDVVKMSENDKGYKAVTHDDVAAALHLPLAECGVFMLPEIVEYSNSNFEKTNKYGNVTTWYRTDLKIKVKWINIDKPEDFIESHGASFALDTSDKSFAKAYSLALKIVLLKVHLLESRDGEEQRPFDELNNKSKDETKNQNNGQNQGGYKPKNNNTSAPPQQQNQQNQKPQLISEDQHEQIANLMIKHSLDGKDIENFFLTGFNVKLDQVTFAQADYLIKMLSVDMFSSLDLSMAASDLKTKREARNQTQTQPDPADFVIQLKREYVEYNGKKVRHLSEPQLKTLVAWTDAEVSKDPKPEDYKQLFELNFKIKAFLKSVGV